MTIGHQEAIILSMFRNGAYLAIVAVAACFLQAGTVVHAACPFELAGAQQRESQAATALKRGRTKYNEALENLRYYNSVLGSCMTGPHRTYCVSSRAAESRVKAAKRDLIVLSSKQDKAKTNLRNIERFAKTHRDCQSLFTAGAEDSSGIIVDKPYETEARIPVAAVRSGESISGAASVVDGDTIIVQGRRVKLFGIDAPEIKQTCRKGGMTWPCGEDAADYLRNLLIDDLVTCDQRDRDRLGRIVGVCLIQERDINASLVRQGWALANPDTSTDYVAVEEAAKDAGVGIWSGEFIPPSAWRRGKR